ncbi:putative transmembrane anti-sigma factor [Cystobacter fuscus DSM 2262]|uniref:Transmembrane anti-sigma factor n=1 Tax=Cystobacter fuscus (strain ATCC 25194 / DSM 2262 / NBRC 100088 / M29) TaxID=1242864 RepID=S9PFR9_CYSF2|nr:zf-HC2 domain-containing protein [Cystobacter fuscus]EPX61926.1 putative transmembrane anti-sigma factor [Cystobacter fuscus DSM 2262]
MTCQEFESILYLYLDGEFQPEERVSAEAHLKGCATCARRVHAEGQLRQSLRRAARHSVETSRAPAALRSRLQANLHQEQRRAAQAAWLRMGAAALVLVTVGGGTWMALRPEHRQRYMEDAVRRHTKKLPVEIVGVSHENVEAWFDGKLDHRVSVPRLHDVRLSGARISNVTDRPAAYISYEHNAEGQGGPARRIGVFVFDDARREVEAPTLPAVQVGSSLGYNVAMWRDGELVYELVSDLNEADIRRMLAEQSAQKAAAVAPTTPSVPVLPVSLHP